MAYPAVHQEELYMNGDVQGAGTAAPMPWLHGAIDRATVDSLMRDNGFSDGLFLIREKSGSPGDYVLSCVAQGKLQHYVVNSKTGRYRIDDGPQFSSLTELVEYYSNNDDRLPTRLKRFCPSTVLPKASQQESYEMVWEAKNTAQAQIGTMGKGTMLSMGGQGMLSMAGQSMLSQDPTQQINAQLKGVTLPRSNRPAIPTPSAGPQAPFSAYEEEEEEVEDVGAVRVIAMEGGSPYAVSNAPPPQSQAPAARKNFTEIPRVKQWIEKGAEVQNVNIVVNDDIKKKTVQLEGLSSDTADRANKHLETFSAAALAEEKMYLIWMNNHLKKLGRDQVPDIGPSLRTGVDVLEVLKVISKGSQPAPMYAKKPMVVQQEIDNWHVVIKYMRKLGIVVDNDPHTGKDSEGVGLDPILLHSADRREFLKFFSKLLLFEAQHS